VDGVSMGINVADANVCRWESKEGKGTGRWAECSLVCLVLPKHAFLAGIAMKLAMQLHHH
jgi:hypothetical protein